MGKLCASRDDTDIWIGVENCLEFDMILSEVSLGNFICQAPVHVLHLMYILAKDRDELLINKEQWLEICTLLSLLNCCLNNLNPFD